MSNDYIYKIEPIYYTNSIKGNNTNKIFYFKDWGLNGATSLVNKCDIMNIVELFGKDFTNISEFMDGKTNEFNINLFINFRNKLNRKDVRDVFKKHLGWGDKYGEILCDIIQCHFPVYDNKCRIDSINNKSVDMNNKDALGYILGRDHKIIFGVDYGNTWLDQSGYPIKLLFAFYTDDMLDSLRDYEKIPSVPENIKGILNELQIETEKQNIKNETNQNKKKVEPVNEVENEEMYYTIVNSKKLLDQYSNIDKFIDLMKEYGVTISSNNIKPRYNDDIYVYKDNRGYEIKIPWLNYLNIALTILSYHGYHFEEKTHNDPYNGSGNLLRDPPIIRDMLLIKNKPDDYFYSYEIQFPEKINDPKNAGGRFQKKENDEKYGIYDFILLCYEFKCQHIEIIVKRKKHNKLKLMH